ncbi:hypothetical protein EIP86_001303 [Pleurotus ostreatoroseus]|nr:hypothetical protein EIP86_001303 [Pleurotus ostreatoroseus]
MADHMGDEITFSTNFPLPYRVLALGGVGLLGWATNLHGLHLLGIDAASALELSTRGAHASSLSSSSVDPETTPLPTHNGWKLVAHPLGVYRPVYRICVQYACVALLSWAVYRHATGGRVDAVDAFKYIPAVTMLFVFMCLVSPFMLFEKRERDKFLYLLSPPAQDGLARWILPTIMRFPTNESKRPLYNAIKYATSFPVIFLSAAQRLAVENNLASGAAGPQHWYNGHMLYNLWLLAAAINSLYSFWWDVTFDWGFDLLRTRPSLESTRRSQSPPRPLVLPQLHSRSVKLGDRDSDELAKEALLGQQEQLKNTPSIPPQRYPFGLRPTLLLPLPIYPFAILVDFVLRMTWSVKLSSHLHAYAEGDRVIFLIEAAEMVRRWMWVFLRVEWEVVKEREVRSKMPPGTRMRRRAPDASLEDEYEMLATNASYDGERSAEG